MLGILFVTPHTRPGPTSTQASRACSTALRGASVFLISQQNFPRESQAQPTNQGPQLANRLLAYCSSELLASLAPVAEARPICLISRNYCWSVPENVPLVPWHSGVLALQDPVPVIVPFETVPLAVNSTKVLLA